MGCDIHIHMEIKVKGKWEHYSHIYAERSYRIFGKLANVRISNDEHFPIKDLPEDCSLITNIDWKYGEGDNHTPSYLTSEELSDLYNWMQSEWEHIPDDQRGGYILTFDFEYWFLRHSYLFGNSYTNFNKYRNEYPEEIEDIRMIFWFDN